MIDDRKIMELIQSVTEEATEYRLHPEDDHCESCKTRFWEGVDKRTMALAIQLARVVLIRGTSEFALDEDVYDTLTEFLANFGDTE